VKTFYAGECDLLEHLLQFEELPINADFEKKKLNLLRKVQVMVSSKMVPKFYLECAFKFSIGCFWLKFTPMFTAAAEILQEIFRQGFFLTEHITLIQEVGYLSQLGHENDVIMDRIYSSIELTKL